MYINNDSNDLLELDLITEEAPIGWSSTCLDQTLFYYLECSHTDESNNKHESNNMFSD